jgi:serine protease Do
MRVDQVIPGATAARAGVRAGDLLLDLAGEPATDIPTVAASIAARNGPTEIRLYRDGRVVVVTVDLRQR